MLFTHHQFYNLWDLADWWNKCKKKQRKNTHLTGQREMRLELGKRAEKTTMSKQINSLKQKTSHAWPLGNPQISDAEEKTNKQTKNQKKPPHNPNRPYHICPCCDPKKGFTVFFLTNAMQLVQQEENALRTQRGDQALPRESL